MVDRRSGTRTSGSRTTRSSTRRSATSSCPSTRTLSSWAVRGGEGMGAGERRQTAQCRRDRRQQRRLLAQAAAPGRRPHRRRHRRRRSRPHLLLPHLRPQLEGGCCLELAKSSTMLSLGGIRTQFAAPENVAMSLFTAEFLRNAGEHLRIYGLLPFRLPLPARRTTRVQTARSRTSTSSPWATCSSPPRTRPRSTWRRTGGCRGSHSSHTRHPPPSIAH